MAKVDMTQYLREPTEELEQRWEDLMNYFFQVLPNRQIKVEARPERGLLWIRKGKYFFGLSIHFINGEYLELRMFDGLGIDLMTLRIPSKINHKRLGQLVRLVKGRMGLYME